MDLHKNKRKIPFVHGMTSVYMQSHHRLAEMDGRGGHLGKRPRTTVPQHHPKWWKKRARIESRFRVCFDVCLSIFLWSWGSFGSLVDFFLHLNGMISCWFHRFAALGSWVKVGYIGAIVDQLKGLRTALDVKMTVACCAEILLSTDITLGSTNWK